MLQINAFHNKYKLHNLCSAKSFVYLMVVDKKAMNFTKRLNY
jgi:hypothetical protein